MARCSVTARMSRAVRCDFDPDLRNPVTARDKLRVRPEHYVLSVDSGHEMHTRLLTERLRAQWCVTL
jgi:hypothetical protein